MSDELTHLEDTRTGSLTIRAYCTCGAKFYASSTPPAGAEAALDIWRGIHVGADHQPCDARAARNARRRELNR